MRFAALVAFVAGVCVLQLQAALPSVSAIVVSGAWAAALACLAALGWRALPSLALALLIVAAAGIAGFAYAAAWSTVRLADELPFADEGRDVVVEGVVSSLPVRLERGVRFEFD